MSPIALNALKVALGVVAAAALAPAVAPSLAPVAAQPLFCGNPAGHCGQAIAPSCLARQGAGSLAADAVGEDARARDCEAQFDRYRACLEMVAGQCGGARDAARDAAAVAPAAASGPCATEARELALWRTATESGDAGALELFIAICPESSFAEFARLTLVKRGVADAETEAAAPASQQSPQAFQLPLLLEAAVSSDAPSAVHAGPGADFPRIGQLRPGRLVAELERDEAVGWSKLGLASGEIGYTPTRFVSPVINPQRAEALEDLPTPEWTAVFGGRGTDRGLHVVARRDGGYYALGFTASKSLVVDNEWGHSDAWLLSLSATGEMSWSRSFGGPDEDNADSVIETADGGFIVVGRTKSFGAGASDAFLVRGDAQGAVSWRETFGGPGEDRTSSTLPTRDGGFVVLGRTDSQGAGSFDFWFFKVDALGRMVWERTYGDANRQHGHVVLPAADGGFYLAGHTRAEAAAGAEACERYSYSRPCLNGEPIAADAYAPHYALLIKTDVDGRELWRRVYGEGVDAELFGKAAQSPDGGLLIHGVKRDVDPAGDAWLMALDQNGDVRWEATFGAAGADVVQDAVSVPGGWLVTGQSAAPDDPENRDAWLILYDDAGQLASQITIDVTADDRPDHVQITQDGAAIMIGRTLDPETGKPDMLVSKIDWRARRRW